MESITLCRWVFSEASLHQQILRHQTLTVHCSLARYTCRPTQSAATSSLLNFTLARPYSRQNFSRLENAADLSSPLTARQRSWLSSCCFCCSYYRGMSGDQTTLTLGQCRHPVTARSPSRLSADDAIDCIVATTVHESPIYIFIYKSSNKHNRVNFVTRGRCRKPTPNTPSVC